MKKTIPTSIAHTIFYIQEDAYQKLDAYLSEVRTYFAGYADSREIIEDIESRIEEQLLEASSKDKTDRIITSTHVDALIKSMGRPQEFGADEKGRSESESSNGPTSPRKKLYRDKENAIIGGVASGLGLYFGIDPIIVRIIFFISIFFGGLGVVAYIFLWFAVPEAKTATEKLEMEGSPVTLNEVKKIVEEKMDEVGGKDAIRKGSEKFRQFFVDVVKKFFGIFGRVIGVILKLIALFGTIFLVTALIIAVTNSPFSFLSTAGISAFAIYGSIGILFVLMWIPILFLGLAGNSLSHPKKSHKTLAGILALIWIMASIAGTVIAFHVARNRDQYAQAFSGGNITTAHPEITAFSKLVVQNSQNVRIIQGKTTSIEISGREHDINSIRVSNSLDTLTIHRKYVFGDCFFCGIGRAEIVITTPSLESLVVENGSKVSFEGSINSLTAVIENGSKVTLSGKATTLNAEIKNASTLLAEEFAASDMEIDMENGSRANVNVIKTIKGELSNGSTLEQYGDAALENLKLANGSHVYKK